VTEGEALQFGCNALTDGQNVYSTTDSLRLSQLLDDLGFTLHPIPLGEFLKGGGGVRCLALPLVEVGADEDDLDQALASTA
jgi:N-dimethylarginine dimethylaminohydrolase